MSNAPPEKPKQNQEGSGLWGILNSKFILWCLSAVFITGGSLWYESCAKANTLEAALRQRRQDLNLELTFRAHRADRLLALAQNRDLPLEPEDRLALLRNALQVLAGEDTAFPEEMAKAPFVAIVHLLSQAFAEGDDLCKSKLQSAYDLAMWFSADVEPVLLAGVSGAIDPLGDSFVEAKKKLAEQIWPYFVKEWRLPSGDWKPRATIEYGSEVESAEPTVECVERSLR